MNHPSQSAASRQRLSAVMLYVFALAATALAFCLIIGVGNGLVAPVVDAGQSTANTAVSAPSSGHQSILHLLVALVVVMLVSRSLGNIFRCLGQPTVIGEVVAGILVGPSLLGWIAPHVMHLVLPQDILPILGIFAQFGVILYMFLVGLDFDIRVLQKGGHAAIAISHASIIAPFLLGAGLALFLYPIVSHNGVPFRSFALFLGVAMSVTAFPVLARILTDCGMHRTPLGAMALACAAIDDVTAWCLLACVVGVAQAKLGAAISITLLTIVYVAAMFLVVGPLLIRLTPSGRPVSTNLVAIFLMGLFGSACLTEYIGIHAVIGAFLFGAIIPKGTTLPSQLRSKLEDLVTVVLLPLFFAFAGMRTEIGLLQGVENWLLCGMIILVASVGKFGGTALAALLGGIDVRNACALGILMNTRGLMELIVLNIGLDLGLISTRLYAMMVVMALVTTVITTPLLKLVLRTSRFSRPAALEPRVAPLMESAVATV